MKMAQGQNCSYKKGLVLLTIFVFFILPCFSVSKAADDEEYCNIYALIAKTREDETLANEMMANAALLFADKMECSLTKKDKEEIKKNPEEAEMIISSRDIECYKKMQEIYAKGDEESNALIDDVTAEAIMVIADEKGCKTSKNEILKVIKREEAIKDKEQNFKKCLFTLHRVLTAEKMQKDKSGEYTTDLNILAPHIVPAGGDALPIAMFALDEIRQSCCAAPDCDEKKPEERWNVDFGIELSKDYNIIIYGYPIGGPNCLVMVTPEKDDPADFGACYREAEEDAAEDSQGGADENK